MIQSTAQRWATAQHPVSDRFDAWDQKLNEVYGTWRSNREHRPVFNAELAYRKSANFQIVDCRCDRCGAVKAPRDVRLSEEPQLALQAVLAGREEFCIDDERYLLTPGDILLWDTTRPMSFRVIEPLHKVSAMVPLSLLRNWIPKTRKAPEGRLESDSTAARLLTTYITNIQPDFLAGNLNNPDGLIEATIGLLINAVGEDNISTPPETLAEVQRSRVLSFIAENLDRPDLGPQTIANQCRISVRYLHWLFKSTDTTVFNYIVQARLQQCRRVLKNRQMDRRTITEIAYAAGFTSPTHFARRFKAEFGASPVDFRRASQDIVAA